MKSFNQIKVWEIKECMNTANTYSERLNRIERKLRSQLIVETISGNL